MKSTDNDYKTKSGDVLFPGTKVDQMFFSDVAGLHFLRLEDLHEFFTEAEVTFSRDRDKSGSSRDGKRKNIISDCVQEFEPSYKKPAKNLAGKSEMEKLDAKKVFARNEKDPEVVSIADHVTSVNIESNNKVGPEVHTDEAKTLKT